MRVYHFLNSEYGLKDLREKRLKVSSIMQLNDPFEFLGIDLANPVLRKSMKLEKKKLAKQVGLICFSRNWQNPVQWAHYANNHKGICLGFDIPDDLLETVTYVEERITAQNVPEADNIAKLLTTKFSHWSYEEESRMFVDLGELGEGFHYKSFSESLTLKQVIIGSRSGTTKGKIVESYGSEKEIEIFKARAAFKSFKIVSNRFYDQDA